MRLERENFHVLGMNGKCIECKPTALHKRRENQNTVALDADQNQIRRRDIVKVMEGPHAVSILLTEKFFNNNLLITCIYEYYTFA